MPDSRKHLLYIDDDAALFRLAAKAGQRHGFTMVHAGSVEEGLAKFAAEDFNAVVLDHNLPTGTGLDFLEGIKGGSRQAPVLYVTGSEETSVAVNALKAGAADYVLKSVSTDFFQLLFSAVEQALEHARLMRQKERAEQEVRAARDRAELLLREVNHRVANSLSLVAAMVRMQASMLSEPTAVAAFAETQARITAIAGVHRRLYTSADVGSVGLDEYLQGLIEELDASMKHIGTCSALLLTAEPVFIPTDKAVSVGVIVTELVTNAIKYAYRDQEPGAVRVMLTTSPDHMVTLTVEDDGVGWDGVTIQGTGLGSKIVRAMTLNLGAELNYEHDRRGTRAVLRFAHSADPQVSTD